MFYNFEDNYSVKDFENIKSYFKKKLLARFVKNINHLNVYQINDLRTLDILLKYGLNPNKYILTKSKDSIKETVDTYFTKNNFMKSIKTTEKLEWLNKNNFPLEKIIKSRVSFLPNEEVRQYYVEHIVTPEQLSKDKDLRWYILMSDDLDSLFLYKKIFQLGIDKQNFYKEAFSHSAYKICKHMLLKEGCLWDEELYNKKEDYLKSQKDDYVKAKKENNPISTIYKSSALLYNLKNEIIENEKNTLDKIMNEKQNKENIPLIKNQKRL